MIILRFKKWKFYTITTLILIFIVLMTLKNSFKININKLRESEKCPMCYGLVACYLVDNNRLTINHNDIYTLFSNYFGKKNVYFGKIENVDVVLKKLANEAELQYFDERVNQHKEKKNSDFRSLVEKAVNTDMSDTMSKLRLCPTIKNINLLFHNIINDKHFMYEHLWTLIKINPEPLILQILPASLGWPVPKYYGACGRLVVEEFVGPMLSTYYMKAWIHRAEIASNLLDAAYMFTFRNENFSFYLTDVSPDNIAIDSNNTAKFIDLENIIVVDKMAPVKDQINSWQDIHISDSNFDYETSLIFSPADICGHKISDHNYYAICKHILAMEYSKSQIYVGFLHDIPAEILSQYTTLMNLIRQCSKPDSFHNRISTGLKLNKLLKNIVRSS